MKINFLDKNEEMYKQVDKFLFFSLFIVIFEIFNLYFF